MKCLATLCAMQDEGVDKIIAISPDGDKWFVNRDDLTPAYKTIADETETGSQITVLGMLFGPGED